MDLTEQMVSYAAQQVLGTQQITYQGNAIDFTSPWERLELRAGLKQVSGIDIANHQTAELLFQAIAGTGKMPDPGPCVES